jgi:hypothetical protein
LLGDGIAGRRTYCCESLRTHAPTNFSKMPAVELCEDVLIIIAGYLAGEDIARWCCVSSRFRLLFSADMLWRPLCDVLRMKPFVPMTRTRGILPFKKVYEINLCCECRNNGATVGRVIINTGNKLAHLVSVCSTCFVATREIQQFADRRRNGLLRTKARLGESAWETLLRKIPSPKHKSCKKATKESDVDWDGAFHNDFLLNKLR